MESRDFAEASCRAFTEALASAAPVPGGGGAAALVGALGAALGGMVAALTVGKKKYANVEAEIRVLSARCAYLREAFLDAVHADAEAFAPLAEAYAIPKDAPNRACVIGTASLQACDVPMRILELCAEAVEIAATLAEKGTRLAVSDAGCAAACIRAAAQSAVLNIRINTKSVPDRAAAEGLNRTSAVLMDRIEAAADAVYAKVLLELG